MEDALTHIEDNIIRIVGIIAILGLALFFIRSHNN